MPQTLPYLTKSKTGLYSYRRRIPEHLRPSFGNKLEFKKALGTTSYREAAARWRLADNQYEAIASRYARLQNADVTRLGQDVTAEAASLAETLTRPVLHAGASLEERQKFERDEEAWLAAIENTEEHLADRYTDWKRMQSDYEGGQWGQAGYETPYLPTRHDDPNVLALQHVKSGKPLQLKPTWGDATAYYMHVNRAEAERDTSKQAVYEKKTSSLLKKFGLSLGKQGMSTPLEMISRQHARAYLEQHKPATGNRYNNTFSAVINCWNQEFPDQRVNNPFAGLSNKAREGKTSTKRKSFSPEQWSAYVQALEGWHNQEIGLIGLIMAFTGCRPSEAAGLAVAEVRLDEKVPNLVFRSNAIRSMDKGGLERAVPIFEPLASYLRSYNDTAPRTGDRASRFFHKYGEIRHFSNVSQQLGNILRDTVGIMDKTLVTYSFRHTIHDRARAAKVPTAIQEYVVGHKSRESSRIHERYGTRTPPSALVDDMKAIFSQQEWETDFD